MNCGHCCGRSFKPSFLLAVFSIGDLIVSPKMLLMIEERSNLPTVNRQFAMTFKKKRLQPV